MTSFIKRFFITTALVFPLLVSAQQSQMTLEMSPEAPGPYEQVTISVVSYSFDVNTSMIEWTVGDKTYASGMGIKKITLTTGPIGEFIPILVKVASPSGEVLQTGINLSPQSTDVVWESLESYVPPFYEGLSLPGEGSQVRLTALPNMSEGGAPISPNNLSYLWYVNDSYIDAQSGVGRQSAIISLDFLSDSTNVTLRVRSANGSVAEKTITIYPHNVTPVLYLYNDILGTNYSRALGERFETTGDFTLSYIPYYMSTRKGLDSSVNIDWSLDGLPVTPIEKTLLTLQPKENSLGSKKLAISIGSTKRLLQKAMTNMEIIFDTRK
jgi:hypothetical protein